ncbi:hypothetical protein [Variovorax sp. J31P207]|uniref:hypothetical protein n=1 Tax=Variovorax sp. J31P207 TaxID=3053510 RepID=UPI002576FC2F|nr:hypothetical protein [Variovorax sp. J31P207]MDM0071452.1 hypothetical protein [Variovorax sp. J31P207]
MASSAPRFDAYSDVPCARTCLASYDLTHYPEDTGLAFTEFFFPRAFGSGLRLEDSAAAIWNEFIGAHAAAQLHEPAEIAMDYFTRAVEFALINGPQWDSLALELGASHWERAVRESGYVVAQRTVHLQA